MSHPQALTASRYIAGVQQMLAERGVDPAALLCGTGISQAVVDDIDGYIDARQLDCFLANAIELGADPAPGLALGRRLNLSAHGSAGFAGLTAADARQAMQVAVRFFPLVTQAVELSFEEDRAFANLRILPQPGLSPRCEQFVIETLLSSISLMAGFLLGEQAISLRLELPGESDPALLDGLAEIRDGVRFNRPGYRIRLPRDVLDTRFALSDPQAHRLALARCEAELARLNRQGGFSQRLFRQLLAGNDPCPSIEDIARELRVSSRTIHRRLAREGKCFRDIASSARMQRAKQLLDQGHGVTDTAHLLGYSDSANFTRAFRQHTGQTPTAFIAHSSGDGNQGTSG